MSLPLVKAQAAQAQDVNKLLLRNVRFIEIVWEIGLYLHNYECANKGHLLQGQVV